jgi:hypothetical protein
MSRHAASRVSENAKVSVFGTCDCEVRIAAKGEFADRRPRTNGAKVSGKMAFRDAAALAPDTAQRDASDRLGTPASKG